MLIVYSFYVQSFKSMITLCLVKDPSKRPTAEQLLRHPFFKHARTSEYIYQHVLDGLSPLNERAKNLKVGNKFSFEDYVYSCEYLTVLYTFSAKSMP